MMFCPKCGGILFPSENKRKKGLVCRCGYSSRKKQDLVINEELKKDEKDKIEIIDKKVNALPKTDEKCPKCSFDKAYYWTIQTRAGDESETRFFECVKCSHRWRAYD